MIEKHKRDQRNGEWRMETMLARRMRRNGVYDERCMQSTIGDDEGGGRMERDKTAKRRSSSQKIELLGLLEHSQDRLNALHTWINKRISIQHEDKSEKEHTKPALGIANIQWVLLHSKLASKIAFPAQMERMRDPIIRLLQRPDLEPANVIHAMQRPRRAGTERRSAYAGVAEFLDDMREDVLDGAERGIGELKGPFDLEAVDGGKLSEYNE